MHQVIVETTNYLSALVSQDIQSRHKMSHRLRTVIETMPSDTLLLKASQERPKSKSGKWAVNENQNGALSLNSF